MYLSAGSPELAQALELAARDHLKSLRDWNFHWLLGCTFAVGIGLLMELPEIVHDMCKIRGRESREHKYWLSPSIDRREYPRRDWVKKWSAFGGVLIVLGVRGEGWFEAQVSKYDSALSTMTDAVVAKAQQESANAEATTKGFDAQIAAAQRDAAEAKKEAESERLARVKVEAAVAWRHLSARQKSDIGANLRDFATRAGVSLWYIAGDTEGLMFASDIAESLRVGHILVQPPGGLMGIRESGHFNDPIKRDETGVILQSTEDKASILFANAIVNELTSRGFDAAISKDLPFTKGDRHVSVIVEARPEGPQGEFKLDAEREARAKNRSRHKTK